MDLPDQPDSHTPTSFADLQIHPDVLRAVSDVGYESPSAVQAATRELLEETGCVAESAQLSPVLSPNPARTRTKFIHSSQTIGQE